MTTQNDKSRRPKIGEIYTANYDYQYKLWNHNEVFVTPAGGIVLVINCKETQLPPISQRQPFYLVKLLIGKNIIEIAIGEDEWAMLWTKVKK